MEKKIRVSRFENEIALIDEKESPTLNKILDIIKETYPNDIPTSAKDSDIIIHNGIIYFEYYTFETDQEYEDRIETEREKDLKEIKRLIKKFNEGIKYSERKKDLEEIKRLIEN